MSANNARAVVRSPEIAIADLPMSHPVPAAIGEDAHRVFVDRGLALRGEFSGCDHLAIAGHVETDVALRILNILQPGSFKGSASVGDAHIAGRYEGALTVADTLVVGPGAYIAGSVQCGKLQLADGGRIEGDLRVLSEEAKKAEEPLPEAVILEASAGAEAEVAIDAVETEATQVSGAVDAMIASATALEEGAVLAETESTFQSALKTNLGDAAALSGLGHLARQRGDLAGALRYFEMIMATDAENISVRCVSIDILRALSRHAEAAALTKEVLVLRARQSLSVDADTADVPASPAFEEAEAMFRSVLDRHPENLGALAGLGHLARRRGDREAMQKYYTAALALEPTNIPLRVEVALALKEQGDVALARQILETVLDERRSAQAQSVAAG